jgi:hypothetical protein
MNQRRTVIRRPANHALHGVLTAVTLGMWAPVWFVMAVVGRRQVITHAAPPLWNPNGNGPGSGAWQYPGSPFSHAPGPYVGPDGMWR